MPRHSLEEAQVDGRHGLGRSDAIPVSALLRRAESRGEPVRLEWLEPTSGLVTWPDDVLHRIDPHQS